jgi:hypothetical protein
VEQMFRRYNITLRRRDSQMSWNTTGYGAGRPGFHSREGQEVSVYSTASRAAWRSPSLLSNICQCLFRQG